MILNIQVKMLSLPDHLGPQLFCFAFFWLNLLLIERATRCFSHKSLWDIGFTTGDQLLFMTWLPDGWETKIFWERLDVDLDPGSGCNKNLSTNWKDLKSWRVFSFGIGHVVMQSNGCLSVSLFSQSYVQA